MSDNKLTMIENIFREMITVIGYDRAVEIMKSITTEKPMKEEKPMKAEKPKKEETVEKKKRIPRMSPTLATQLKTELTNVGIKYSDDDKKEFEKIKKDFVTFVDDLTDDDFTGKGLTDHMRDFANTKKPVETGKTEEKPVVVDTKTVKTDEKPKKVSKKSVEKTKPAEAVEPPSNAATIHEISLKELQEIEKIATPSGDANGVYWDADNGRWVRGPDSDSDEDLVESKFQGKTYMVGEKSGRVYEDTDDRDMFHGFVGVGKFHGMKMP